MKWFRVVLFSLLVSCSNHKSVVRNSASSEVARLPAQELSFSSLSPSEIEQMRNEAMLGTSSLRIESDEFYASTLQLIYQLEDQKKVSKKCPAQEWLYSHPDESNMVKISNKIKRQCSYVLKNVYLFVVPRSSVTTTLDEYRPTFHDASVEIKFDNSEKQRIELSCDTQKSLYQTITDCGFKGKPLSVSESSEIMINFKK